MGKTIMDNEYITVFEKGIALVRLPWDIDKLIDEPKDVKHKIYGQKLGIFRIDIQNKEVLWFNSLQDAARHFNRTHEEQVSTIELREVTKMNTKYRMYKGFYWCMAFDFSEENLNYNYLHMPKPIVSSEGEHFKDTESAARYLIDKNIAKGSLKRVMTSINKNVRGESKTSYKRTWKVDEN